MKKNIFKGLLACVGTILMFSSLTGCSEITGEAANLKDAKPVRVLETTEEEYVYMTGYKGFTVAKDITKLSFEQPGKVKSLYVEKGQAIQAGDVLAELDTEYSNMALDNARQNVLLAQNGVEQLKDASDKVKLGISAEKVNLEKAIDALEAEKINLSKAETALEAERLNLKKIENTYETALEKILLNYNDIKDKHDKIQTLYQQGIVSQKDYDEIKLGLDTVTTELKNTETSYVNDLNLQKKNIENMEKNNDLQKISIQNSEKNIKLQKINIQNTQKQLESVYTQIEGAKVKENQADIGVRQQEKQLNDSKLISPFSGYVIETLVKAGEETAAGYPVAVIKSEHNIVKIGIPVEDRSKIKQGTEVEMESMGENFSGKITLISQYPDEATRTYYAEITPTNRDLTPGSIVDVKIPTESKKGILLPIRAVFNTDGVNYVYCVEKNPEGADVTVRKEVVLGETYNDKVVVTNLPNGLRVVTEGTKYIKENQKVRVD